MERESSPKLSGSIPDTGTQQPRQQKVGNNMSLFVNKLTGESTEVDVAEDDLGNAVFLNGTMVVVERHHDAPERILGAALTLGGAMHLVLTRGNLSMLVPNTDESDPTGMDSVHTSSNVPYATNLFRWVDPSDVYNSHVTFTQNEGVLNAVFQDENTNYYVHWTDFTL
jgi:hypothetical protein